MRIFFERLGPRVGGWLEFAGPDFGFGLGGEPREVGDMIVVGVGNKYVAKLQAFGVNQIQHRLTGCTGIECCCDFVAGVPNKKTIHRHIFVDGIEGGESGWKNWLLGIPTFVGERFERLGRKLERSSNTAQDRVKQFAGLHCCKVRQRYFSSSSEILVGNVQAALGLIDYIVEIVFERNTGHGRWSKAHGATAPR